MFETSTVNRYFTPLLSEFSFMTILLEFSGVFDISCKSSDCFHAVGLDLSLW